MITLYTAVGRYELRKNENGEKQPIVTVDQKEMALSREELLLWSCLMWEILTKEEAKTYFLKKAVRMDVSQERFDAVLQRLEVYPVQRFLHVSQMMKLILLLETSRSFRRRRHAIISVSFCGFVTDIERLWRRFLHYI